VIEHPRVNRALIINKVAAKLHILMMNLPGVFSSHIGISLLNFYCSELPPDIDESDVGTRDPALKSTYKGLVNIQYGLDFSYCIILFTVFAQNC
jgi:hypothetical protein